MVFEIGNENISCTAISIINTNTEHMCTCVCILLYCFLHHSIYVLLMQFECDEKVDELHFAGFSSYIYVYVHNKRFVDYDNQALAHAMILRREAKWHQWASVTKKERET